jgi:hypothetical protein
MGSRGRRAAVAAAIAATALVGVPAADAAVEIESVSCTHQNGPNTLWPVLTVSRDGNANATTASSAAAAATACSGAPAATRSTAAAATTA